MWRFNVFTTYSGKLFQWLIIHPCSWECVISILIFFSFCSYFICFFFFFLASVFFSLCKIKHPATVSNLFPHVGTIRLWLYYHLAKLRLLLLSQIKVEHLRFQYLSQTFESTIFLLLLFPGPPFICHFLCNTRIRLFQWWTLLSGMQRWYLSAVAAY